MSNQLSKDPYRGTRDFAPRDMFLQTYIFNTWRNVCQSFGYEEYMTPTIEPIDLYTAKTSQEIVSQQTYSFEDRGGRNITIRPEMTPSVARLVAQQRQESGYPLRLFSIPNCMRYERPQKGRLREFWQLNADIFGDDTLNAEYEMLKLADDIMKAFGADESMYEIRINSKKTLRANIEMSVPKTNTEDIVRLIDSKDKMSTEEFEQKLKDSVENVASIECYLSDDYSNLGKDSSVKQTIDLLEKSGTRAVFDPSLARGFDYYTDIVFEVFDKHPENNRSMFGGGRYDNLVGMFGVDPLPTVGFGMGDATLAEFLRLHELTPDYMPATELIVATLEGTDPSEVQELASDLREDGVNVAVDVLNKKADKKIKSAIKLGVPFMVFIGDKEIESGEVVVKNLREETEHTMPAENIPAFIADYFEIDE
ncbi:TPA: histidine--tRNA ligase [Candidatus Saccharibacteria bacterium]|nr:histidine--tRNA ligase [Candidatus Saccharibacteria bacterium]HIO87421.1 histidine--tRNA ligase [Candidatus Saccharibacteria bacterium]